MRRFPSKASVIAGAGSQVAPFPPQSSRCMGSKESQGAWGMASGANGRKTFRLILIKPSHYDDDGYVIQWLRSPIPANSLACLYGLALDAQARDVLAPDYTLDVEAIDETNTRVRPDRIAKRIAEA